MSQQFGQPYSSRSWNQTWISALTQPSEATYQAIAGDVNATMNRAYTWVAAASAISYLILIVIQLCAASVALSGRSYNSSAVLGSVVGSALCGIPFAIVGSIVGFAIVTGLSHLIAKALGGTGNYNQLSYAVAAYAAPLSIISSVIAYIPIVNCLGIVLGVYGIVLNVMAIKAVHGFGWDKAILSSVAILALILVLVACVVIVLLVLLGPAMGNVFSNIIRSL
jgi:hypothetical protein